MSQEERLIYLIDYLMNERDEYKGLKIPEELTEKKHLLRALMNVRPALPINQEFLKIQDDYLRCEQNKGTITDIKDLSPVEDHLYIWQGDITTLKVDAIVNAANSAMLGCFVPCHGCIDNAIHSYAGVQLRLACQKIMEKQGGFEETGKAKITKGYNLPSAYVIHTVGPIIRGFLTKKDKDLLSSCYQSCLELADYYGLKSIAFCCISTGEFHFPNDKAAQIAVETVKKYLRETGSNMEVIFNVFKDEDLKIYNQLLG